MVMTMFDLFVGALGILALVVLGLCAVIGAGFGLATRMFKLFSGDKW